MKYLLIISLLFVTSCEQDWTVTASGYVLLASDSTTAATGVDLHLYKIKEREFMAWDGEARVQFGTIIQVSTTDNTGFFQFSHTYRSRLEQYFTVELPFHKFQPPDSTLIHFQVVRPSSPIDLPEPYAVLIRIDTVNDIDNHLDTLLNSYGDTIVTPYAEYNYQMLHPIKQRKKQ